MPAIPVVDVGRGRIGGRTEQHELGTRRVHCGHRNVSRLLTGERGVQTVGGLDGLRSGVLEQLELMMEMVDGAGSLALTEPAPHTRSEHGRPQQNYEDQQDHNRHSPTRRPTFALGKKPNELLVRNGGWWGKCTVPTQSAIPRWSRLYLARTGEARRPSRPRSAPPERPHSARLHHRPDVEPTVTPTPKQSETPFDVMTSCTRP